jgi:hypothetical protein
MTGMEKVRLNLKGERPDSWNGYWAGMHWTKRKAARDRVHMVVREQIDPDKAKIFDVPVHITIITYFKNRPKDAPNVCTKPYIDALIGWYIEDDDIKHLPKVTSEAYIDKRSPRMIIEIEPIKEPPF